MAGEYDTVPLGDVASVRSGFAFKSSDWSETGIPVVKIANIKGGNLVMDGCSFVPPAIADSAAEFKLQAGDILIAMTGYIGDVAIVRERDLPAVLNQRVGRFSIRDPLRLDPRFLLYVLRDDDVRKEIESLGYGSAQPNVSPSSIHSVAIPLPPLAEQRAIAHILGTLDDKIELNRRMSETLEATARALFESWFVRFDPVRRNMARKGRGQPSPAASRHPLPLGEDRDEGVVESHAFDHLFPDRLVDSELGEIPEGWEVGTLGQVLGELVSGARPKGGAAQEGVPSVGAENVIGLGRYDFSREKYVPRDFFNKLQRKGAAVRPGDVLLYKDGAQIGRKTYFDCGFPHEQCAVNEHVFIVRAKHAHYQRYLFFWLDQDWMTQEIISLNSNSAQPGINQQGVRALPLLKPPDAMVEAFDRLSKKLTDRLFAACHESRTLAALRDALLPKLIRGEIRVKDAERFLKERGL